MERAVGKSRRIDLKKPGPLPAQVLDYNNFNMGVILLEIEKLEINPDTMKLEIDIMEVPENCVIVISEGRAKLRELPPFGEYKIITHQGKVKRMRKEEGEEF